MIAAIVWCFWPVVVELVRDWNRNDDYSVGMLVPPAAIYLVWHQRHRLAGLRIQPSLVGLGLLLAAMAIRLLGMVTLFESGERYAMVIAAIGALLWIFGFPIAWRLRWTLAFLFLMVPLPGQVHNFIAGPLQNWATAGSVFVLELIGVPVTSEGNVILLNHSIHLAVAEACSGLRMLSAFVVVSATLAILVRRPAWQKAVIALSSIPVALACNVLRLVATAVLYLKVSSKAAEQFVHDFAGLAMMPVAVLLLIAELWLLKTIFSDGTSPETTTVSSVAEDH